MTLDYEDIDDGQELVSEEVETSKSRRNTQGKQTLDYVDNQKLYSLILEWQESVNDWVVKNEDLLIEYYPEKKDGNSYEKALAAAKQAGAFVSEPKVPDTIGLSILRICMNYSQKSNWSGYTWREEMVDDAVMDCVRGIRKFNSLSYTNPFAYFTQVAHWAFTGRIQKEKQEHERKMSMVFDPTNQVSYSTLDGDTTVYDVGIEDLSDFYYSGKTTGNSA